MKRLIKSFGYALQGLVTAWHTEYNLRIHLIITLLVFIFSFWIGISTMEWIIVLLCIGWIVTIELLNTAIEKVCNKITIDYDLQIKNIKDVSAAAVIWSSVIVSIIGMIIFLPKIIEKLS